MFWSFVALYPNFSSMWSQKHLCLHLYSLISKRNLKTEWNPFVSSAIIILSTFHMLLLLMKCVLPCERLVRWHEAGPTHHDSSQPTSMHFFLSGLNSTVERWVFLPTVMVWFTFLLKRPLENMQCFSLHREMFGRAQEMSPPPGWWLRIEIIIKFLF